MKGVRNMKNKRYVFVVFAFCVMIAGVVLGISGQVLAKGPTLNKTKATISVGDSLKLKVKSTEDDSGKINWYSSNQKVAKVSAKGKVTAYREGSVKITAKFMTGKYKYKKLVCAVTVKENSNENDTQYTFRYDSYLEEHYEKHGIEMGFSSKEEYLKAANDVINNPASLHKLEAEDNDHVYYLEETNEIVFVSQDGYIRTYFHPSGKEYFERQAGAA